ncbi:4Fe-4S binding protein [Sporomusa sphaeroides]|uniref:nucleotide-binding protein n=1 Tax=Sporomusa sphaeroides TaxID=47679 RepID=UPI002C0CB348|nr:4Fe-4S binding protein [Sporomusa sphaeroides]HML34917.1 4Fe-4S binding protein [Sporomusa sphaeroides]
MKELVIASGKGGTGKASISAALAFVAPQKVLVDCDVDAANFHLISGAVIRETHAFKAGFELHIDAKACTRCGKCTDLCRFGAITDGVMTTPLSVKAAAYAPSTARNMPLPCRKKRPATGLYPIPAGAG